MKLSALIVAGGLAAAFTLAGCKSAYYGAWEKLGWHKRDILVDRVEAARDGQEEAKQEFANALEHFIAVTNYDGGELEARYRELNKAYESSKAKAQAVHDRVDAVESVAEELFKEWERELDQYESADLRRASEQQLRDTKSRYKELIAAMHEAESRMDPVLKAFHDQVLFLKHNLNARAIASLKTASASLQDDVAALVREMEESIARANSFIEQMGTAE